MESPKFDYAKALELMDGIYSDDPKRREAAKLETLRLSLVRVRHNKDPIMSTLVGKSEAQMPAELMLLWDKLMMSGASGMMGLGRVELSTPELALAALVYNLGLEVVLAELVTRAEARGAAAPAPAAQQPPPAPAPTIAERERERERDGSQPGGPT